MPFTANLEQDVTISEAPAGEVQALALESALNAIQADSTSAAESYLHETVVPHGGE